MKKRIIHTEIDSIDIFSLAGGSFDKAIEVLNNKKNYCESKSVTNFHIEVEYENNDDDFPKLVIYGERLETDDEFKKRRRKAEKEKLKKLNQREKEFKIYKELHRKFGGSDA